MMEIYLNAHHQQHIGQEMELKTGHSSENTISCDEIEDYNSGKAKLSSKNTKDLLLRSSDVSTEQLLRKRDESNPVSSDISKQGSVHLEPLTPSSEFLNMKAQRFFRKVAVISQPE